MQILWKKKVHFKVKILLKLFVVYVGNQITTLDTSRIETRKSYFCTNVLKGSNFSAIKFLILLYVVLHNRVSVSEVFPNLFGEKGENLYAFLEVRTYMYCLFIHWEKILLFFSVVLCFKHDSWSREQLAGIRPYVGQSWTQLYSLLGNLFLNVW